MTREEQEKSDCPEYCTKVILPPPKHRRRQQEERTVSVGKDHPSMANEHNTEERPPDKYRKECAQRWYFNMEILHVLQTYIVGGGGGVGTPPHLGPSESIYLNSLEN